MTPEQKKSYRAFYAAFHKCSDDIVQLAMTESDYKFMHAFACKASRDALLKAANAACNTKFDGTLRSVPIVGDTWNSACDAAAEAIQRLIPEPDTSDIPTKAEDYHRSFPIPQDIAEELGWKKPGPLDQPVTFRDLRELLSGGRADIFKGFIAALDEIAKEKAGE